MVFHIWREPETRHQKLTRFALVAAMIASIIALTMPDVSAQAIASQAQAQSYDEYIRNAGRRAAPARTHGGLEVNGQASLRAVACPHLN
jgi:hypothetical protein